MLIPHEHNLFSDSINNEEEKESDLASISVSLKKHPAANPFPQASAVKRREFFLSTTDGKKAQIGNDLGWRPRQQETHRSRSRHSERLVESWKILE
jgi:hypothetical protein